MNDNQKTTELVSVACALRTLGYNAEVYNSGGNIMTIAIAAKGDSIHDYRIIIGNGDDWGFDLFDELGEFVRGDMVNEITDTDSSEQIALTLVQAIVSTVFGETAGLVEQSQR